MQILALKFSFVEDMQINVTQIQNKPFLAVILNLNS